MKAYGIGLIILLIAFAMGVYAAYISYKWTSNPPDYTKTEEVKAMNNEFKLATLIGLIANMLALLGILVFLVEFIRHEHPHEHEVSAPRIAPPPP